MASRSAARKYLLKLLAGNIFVLRSNLSYLIHQVITTFWYDYSHYTIEQNTTQNY